MMFLFYVTVSWFLVIFGQVVISPRLAVSNIYPDFVIVVVVLTALKKGWRFGLWFGFALGFGLDLMDPQNLGWMTLLVAIVGYFAGVTRGKIFLDNIFFQSITITAFTLVYQILIVMVSWPGFFYNNLWASFSDSVLIAVYSGLAGVAGLFLLKQKFRLKELL